MQDEFFFGPYERILNIGDTQNMTYRESDPGPFYLTPEQKQQQKFTRTIPGQFVSKSKTKGELMQELAEKNIDCTIGNNFAKIKELCETNNIDLKHAPQPKTIQGCKQIIFSFQVHIPVNSQTLSKINIV